MSNSTKSSLPDDQYLDHILTEISRINDAMRGKSLHDLENDWELEHKVTRSLEIMGEASSRISAAFKSVHNDIPWKQMIGVRNRVIHQYFDIHYSLLFDIIQTELPSLTEKLMLLQQQHKTNNIQQKRSANFDRPLLVKTITNPHKGKRRKL